MSIEFKSLTDYIENWEESVTKNVYNPEKKHYLPQNNVPLKHTLAGVAKIVFTALDILSTARSVPVFIFSLGQIREVYDVSSQGFKNLQLLIPRIVSAFVGVFSPTTLREENGIIFISSKSKTEKMNKLMSALRPPEKPNEANPIGEKKTDIKKISRLTSEIMENGCVITWETFFKSKAINYLKNNETGKARLLYASGYSLNTVFRCADILLLALRIVGAAIVLDRAKVSLKFSTIYRDLQILGIAKDLFKAISKLTQPNLVKKPHLQSFIFLKNQISQLSQYSTQLIDYFKVDLEANFQTIQTALEKINNPEEAADLQVPKNNFRVALAEAKETGSSFLSSSKFTIQKMLEEMGFLRDKALHLIAQTEKAKNVEGFFNAYKVEIEGFFNTITENENTILTLTTQLETVEKQYKQIQEEQPPVQAIQPPAE